jgi:hypothetical protein
LTDVDKMCMKAVENLLNNVESRIYCRFLKPVNLADVSYEVEVSASGVVSEVNVSAGQSVESQAPLLLVRG